MTDADVTNNQTEPVIQAFDFDAPKAPSLENTQAALESFSPSSTTLTVNRNAPWWHSQFNLMLCVFALLALAAMALIWLAPEPEISSSQELSNAAEALTQAQTAEQESPWDESRRTQARTDSQEILSNMLDSKKALENKGVQSWAAAEFDSALAFATQGDEFYKLQDYESAIATYQSALDQLDSLHELIPAQVEKNNQSGLAALAEGKSQLAQDAFSFALKLDPDNIQAVDGLGRAKQLDQVLALVQLARAEEQRYEQNDELASLITAQQTLQQAIELDDVFIPAVEGLKRIEGLIVDKQFRNAMSKGYAALFKARFSRARSAFSNALKIKPDNTTANAAYQQTLASNKSSSLKSMLANATQFEAQEDWQNALSNYKAVLQRGPNQVSAKLGEIRSNARAELDSQLRDVLSDTLSLSKPHRKQEANRVLKEARAIRSKGPKISQQIAQIEAALNASTAVIKVNFLSDAQTDISLTKEGAQKIDLGRFTNKKLALKPGRYVLNGVRIGYRDVRREIELLPGDNSIQSFNISCDEPISTIVKELANDTV